MGSCWRSSAQGELPLPLVLELAGRPGMASWRSVKRSANPRDWVPAFFRTHPNSPAVSVVGSRRAPGPEGPSFVSSALTALAPRVQPAPTYLPRYHPIRRSGTRNRYISMTTVRGVWGVWGVGMGCLGCPWVSEAYFVSVGRSKQDRNLGRRGKDPWFRGFSPLTPCLGGSAHVGPIGPPAHWVKPALDAL